MSGIRNSRRNARFTFPIAVLGLQWRNLLRKKEIARSPRAVVQRKIIAFACIHFNLRSFCLLLGRGVASYREIRGRVKSVIMCTEVRKRESLEINASDKDSTICRT